jgi:hypothetical protein
MNQYKIWRGFIISYFTPEYNRMRLESVFALRIRYVDLVQACIDACGHHFQHLL